MALVLSKSVFLHTPKTAGWWVRNSLKRAGLHGIELGHEHESFKSGLLRCGEAGWWRGKTVIVFVRHPARWYQSFWSFRMKRGWSMAHPLDFECACNDFNEFVTRVMDGHPGGWLTGMLSEYVDYSPAGTRTVVGRMERLRVDLLSALRQAGEEFEDSAFDDSRRANDSDLDGLSSSDLAVYDPDVLRRVLAVESGVVNRWYGPFWEEAYGGQT